MYYFKECYSFPVKINAITICCWRISAHCVKQYEFFKVIVSLEKSYFGHVFSSAYPLLSLPRYVLLSWHKCMAHPSKQTTKNKGNSLLLPRTYQIFLIWDRQNYKGNDIFVSSAEL